MNQYTAINSKKEFVEVVANSFESALRLYRDLSLGEDPVQLFLSKHNIRVAEDVVDPTFTVHTNDPLMGNIYPASGQIATGSELYITAVPNALYQFVSWSIGGVLHTENPLRIVVTESVIIDAVFELIP